nr:FAD-dependent thymidylate synthase [Anaerolineae bacterium]
MTNPDSDNGPRLPDPNNLAVRLNVLGDSRSWVELQDMLPHPSTGIAADTAIVNAARVSFLGHSKGEESDKKLLFYLLRHQHTTPFEQVEFRFRVRAPVVVWWQWVRHRTWHYNFQSGRYTPFEENDFYIPHEWRKQSEANKQGSAGTLPPQKSQELTQQMMDCIQSGYKLYQDALDSGVAKEQARLFLPAWCSYYIAVCKVDAWNLLNFLRLRTAAEAQWEIRQYALAILDIIKPYMPWTTEAYSLYLAHS